MSHSFGDLPHKTKDALVSVTTVYCGLLLWEVEALSKRFILKI